MRSRFFTKQVFSRCSWLVASTSMYHVVMRLTWRSRVSATIGKVTRRAWRKTTSATSRRCLIPHTSRPFTTTTHSGRCVHLWGRGHAHLQSFNHRIPPMHVLLMTVRSLVFNFFPRVSVILLSGNVFRKVSSITSLTSWRTYIHS